MLGAWGGTQIDVDMQFWNLSLAQVLSNVHRAYDDTSTNFSNITLDMLISKLAPKITSK